jgi:hypothetical protein
MDKETIKSMLHENVCQVVFKKVTNNHFRVMYATRNPVFVPSFQHGRLEYVEPYTQWMISMFGSHLTNWMIVWDFIHHDWRSFYSDTVLDIDINVPMSMIKQYDGKIKSRYALKTGEDGPSYEKLKGYHVSGNYKAFSLPNPGRMK